MHDILYALGHVPTILSEWRKKGKEKKIKNAVTQLRRIQIAENDAKVRGVHLMKGDVFIAPHPAAKPTDAFPVPWHESGGQEHFFHQLGRLSFLMQLQGHHDAFHDLRQEITRVEGMLLPPLPPTLKKIREQLKD